MWIKSCERSGHKEKATATAHDGGGLRSVCARCGVPIALKIGGWKAIPAAELVTPAVAHERRKGDRGTLFDRSVRP
ncbi:MAG: hypothetical protein JWR77_2193 [Rhizorhabdus sp.]|nr:hypothetical protein [Rhizorhabdus sp.]